MKTLLITLAVILLLYLLFVIALIFIGRKTLARAILGFIPDTIVLLKNLMRDKRLSPIYKVILGLLIVYLIFPIDIVPDFIPIAGQLDEVVLVTLVLRLILRTTGKQALRDNWRGPESTLRILMKATGTRDEPVEPAATY